MMVSIIVPCYNEEAALPYFLEAIRKTEAEMTAAWGCTFEVVFVDDGSRDGTLEALRAASEGMRETGKAPQTKGKTIPKSR